MDERSQILFAGKAYVVVAGSKAEQGYDVAGKARVAYRCGFLKRACRGPGNAALLQNFCGTCHAESVGVRLDDGHEVVPLLHEGDDVVAKVFPVDADMA